jgi:hypothetical protein
MHSTPSNIVYSNNLIITNSNHTCRLHNESQPRQNKEMHVFIHLPSQNFRLLFFGQFFHCKMIQQMPNSFTINHRIIMNKNLKQDCKLNFLLLVLVHQGTSSLLNHHVHLLLACPNIGILQVLTIKHYIGVSGH